MTPWVRNIVFLGSFVALVLAEILLSLTNLTALVAQQARTISAYETKDEVERLRIAADATLMSTRSYVLLGDASYTQVFAQAKAQIRHSLEQLKTLMADEPSQSRRLVEIESLFPSLFGNFEKVMLLYDQSGPQAAIAQLRLREDTVLAGRLNDLILKLDGEQGRLLRDRFALDTRQERQAWTLIMLGGALSVFVVFGGAFFVYRDLAQRRHMETELQQKTVLLETTFDNIEQGVAVFDKDSKLVSWSTRFVKFFDLPKGFLYVGQPYAALLRYSAEKGDFLAEDVEAYIERLCEGLRTATNVVLASRVDGRTIDIARKRMPDGSTIATYTDITDRKKIERLKDEFVSTVSHELRTPLTSIRGALGLISGGAFGGVPAEMKPMIDIAHANSERLVRLINDILDIEKIASGSMDFRFLRQRLSPLIRHAVEANSGYAAQYKVHIRYDDRAPDGEASVDGDRLMQVMANLLSNAAKFSTPGANIDVTLARHEGGLRITVQDSGAGIPVAFRRKVFDRFAQADTSDSKKLGGTGLGLSIVKLIVERMLGTIGFTSEVGVGTIFFVDLPEQLRVEHRLVGAVAERSPGRARVLVCEDNQDVALLLRTLLEHGGFAVDVVYTVRQARAALARQEYAVMTLDLMLPDDDGMAFFRSLRSDEKYRHLPVVIVSIKVDQARKELGSPSGGTLDWVQKPIDPDGLLKAVHWAAGGRKDRKPRILHVEDDADVARVVAGIAAGVASIDQADTLEAAKRMLETADYDLVILDLDLPDGSGSELLPLLSSRTPAVIFAAADPPENLTRQVAASLVKTRASNQALLATIRRVLEESARHRKQPLIAE
ncbi:MAG TPA: PAS-domain containing protein [Verrucomicrobiae bacterium]|nr:PAS-domain containing protein [Verrucomicrobiae bacterium]